MGDYEARVLRRALRGRDLPLLGPSRKLTTVPVQPGALPGFMTKVPDMFAEPAAIHLALIPRDMLVLAMCHMGAQETALTGPVESLPAKVPAIVLKTGKAGAQTVMKRFFGVDSIGLLPEPSSGTCHLLPFDTLGVHGLIPTIAWDGETEARWEELRGSSRQWGRLLLVYSAGGKVSKRDFVRESEIVGIREVAVLGVPQLAERLSAPERTKESTPAIGRANIVEPWNLYWDFEVSLREAEPRVWRRFLLKYKSTFLDLHNAIQDAGGWWNYHLFSFSLRPDPYEEVVAGPPHKWDDESEDPDAGRVAIADVIKRRSPIEMSYVYDFGDDWQMDVVMHGLVEESLKFRRRLLGGERAFPQEDSGGFPGYIESVEVASGAYSEAELAEDPDLGSRREWLGDWHPDRFDFEKTRKKFDR